MFCLCPLCVDDGAVDYKRGSRAICGKCGLEVDCLICDRSGHRVCISCTYRHVEDHWAGKEGPQA